jgi:NAD kinase
VFNKIVIVTRKTRLQQLIERFNTRSQAKFCIEHAGGDFSDYEQEDDAYRRALEQVRSSVDFGLPLQLIDRALVSTFLFQDHDLVITLGQDGLVANTAKYAGERPIVGINPEPTRFDGVLLPFGVHQAHDAVARSLEGKGRWREITLAQAVLQDNQRLLAFNELFIGARSHVSALYRIECGKHSEVQSSSGILVSTGAGSTGWVSSIFNMASGISQFCGGSSLNAIWMDWEDPRLLYLVREPFLSRHSGIGLVTGILTAGEELVVESLMPEGGAIFSDGVEADYLPFNSGAIARIRAAERKARLVIS